VPELRRTVSMEVLVKDEGCVALRNGPAMRRELIDVLILALLPAIIGLGGGVLLGMLLGR
jgi:hypothetical protein